MGSPFDLTVTEAAEKIRNRELSVVELVDSLLGRIERLNPRLQSWAFVDFDKVICEARNVQKSIEKDGPHGLLQGVPLGAKDIFYTADMPTEAGARFWSGFIPDHDAACISSIRCAGGILLGKTVTAQFADGDPPGTLNPWNEEYTPGGSSTGSAVSVAARMIPAALGSQTVGSVLRPAAYNGIVGFKPSYGRISKHGVVEYATSFDHVGFLARSVEDVALLLRITEGFDNNDARSIHVPSFVPYPLGNRREPPVITVFRGYFSEASAAETNDNLDVSVRKFREAGAIVNEVSPAIDFSELAEVHSLMVAFEAARYHEDMFRMHQKDYGPLLTTVIERGFGISSEQYNRSVEIRMKAFSDVSRIVGDLGVILTPTASGPAPKELKTTGDLRFQSPWSFLGFPSISLPSGLSGEGLPFGLQLAMGYLEDQKLLECASWCEGVLGPPVLPPGLD